MSQIALDETGIHAGFEQMGGVGMPQGMDGHACFGDPGTVFGGAKVARVVEGGGGREEPPDFLNAENGGEMVCGLRAHEREGVPVALEDVLVEEADATIADAHGRWSEAVDIFPVQEVVLQLLF